MQIYMVGGAVRDALLGLPVKDHDWVVVGATPEEMTAQGFLPVGKDFPVFLHPDTKEEYALARTERKTARGYRGFAIHTSPDVTLEEDLARRDLTINSIAVHADLTRANGTFDIKKETLTDPFGGQRDVADKVFRHVTLAFREDPVRILRVARLAARFTDFTVAPETMELMRDMVADGEADHLVAERVWQELSRGLMAQQPSRMFDVLRACGALDRFLPEVNRLWGVPQGAEHHPEIDTGVHLMMVLDMASRLNAPLAVRFACLTHDLGKGKLGSDSNFVSAQRADFCEHVSVLTNLESDPNFPRHIGHEERGARLLKGLCERLRVPVECRELADVVAREHGHIHRSGGLGAAALVRLLERCDAFRKPRRFEEILLACECDARGRLGLQDTPYPPKDRLIKAFRTVQAVPTHTVAEHAQARGISGKRIGELIHAARIEALAAAI